MNNDFSFSNKADKTIMGETRFVAVPGSPEPHGQPELIYQIPVLISQYVTGKQDKDGEPGTPGLAGSSGKPRNSLWNYKIMNFWNSK